MEYLKNYDNSIKKFLKFIIYNFFSNIIIFSIFVEKIKKKNILYSNCFGFGDYVHFCENIRKKLNKNNKIFCFSQAQFEIAKFFCEEKYIVKSFILMPRLLSESHLGYNFLLNNKIFTPINLTKLGPDLKKIHISDFYVGTTNTINFLKKKINENNISKNVANIFNKPTICLYIKNFLNVKNNHINFQVRQTRDLVKIERLINFLIRKNVNLIILGKERDNFIKILSLKMKQKILKNIFLLKDLSDNYSIQDQAYVALKSIGYIGSLSGAMCFFGLFNKKSVIIDSPLSYNDKYFKNFYFLYKKIYNKKKKTLRIFVNGQYYNPVDHNIIETTYKSIKKTLLIKILNKH
jgi:hypothetical protein